MMNKQFFKGIIKQQKYRQQIITKMAQTQSGLSDSLALSQSAIQIVDNNPSLQFSAHMPEKIDHMAYTQHKLSNKYSSSQSYFYSKTITDIIKEKHTKINLNYTDIECFSEDEENLKRYYLHEEYMRKIGAFKEYYFYHEDCPRIFMQKIEEIYERWHEKRRDIVYKKLKIMYDEDYDSSSNSSSDSRNHHQNEHVITHFLLNVSEYNPYSKNYYLRVQARKQKEKLERQKIKQTNAHKRSKFQLSDLNHELSCMLEGMNNLSMISTLNNSQIVDPTLLKTNVIKNQASIPKKKSQSYEKLLEAQDNRNNQDNHPGIKITFKKNSLQPVLKTTSSKKDLLISMKSKQLIDLKSNVNMKGHQKQLSSLPFSNDRQKKNSMNIPLEHPLPKPEYPYQSTPKLIDPSDGKGLKTRSIFSISSQNAKSTTSLAPTISVRLKKDQLNINQGGTLKVPKINIKSKQTIEKNSSTSNRKISNYQSEHGYRRSQEKDIDTTPQKQIALKNLANNYSGNKASSLKKLEYIEQNPVGMISKNRKRELAEQFSDRKLTGTGSTNFRSYRSQHSESQYRVKLNLGSSALKGATNKTPVVSNTNQHRSNKKINKIKLN